jgi:hypothetical protein
MLPPLVKPKLPSRETVKRRRAIKAPVPLEHAIQSAFVEWTRRVEGRYPELALGFAVPNGGQRSARTAGRLWAEGVRPGVPDWLLPVARPPFIGLAIEFKRPGGALSPAQRAYIPKLAAAGWLVLLCTDAHAAVDSVTNFLALSPK